MPQTNQDEPAVSVRMYCHGLGDCFLITIPRHRQRPFYMLIDCGVILGTTDAKSLLVNVARSIGDVTHELDVLIVTHEHWDHNSGFVDAIDEFKKLVVHEVWVAWTENPSDPLAIKLKAERRRTVAALNNAAQRMRAAAPGSEGSLLEVLGFYGPSAVGAVGGHSTEEAMKNAIALSHRPPRYCRPVDDPVELTELPGVRFFVLGPPQNEQRIKRSLPTKSGKETYDPKVALSPETSFLIAASAGASNSAEFQDPVLKELARPFDSRWDIDPEGAKDISFFQDYYFGRTDGPDQSWRNIDTDWLGTASQLALQLDSYTNNTSLVLAIEFVETKKVLLFPGDAQVGNWLSWGDQSWHVMENGQTREITADDLLSRVVFYKVGHHGSHNATLRAEGLEKMDSPELVAMIPVDHTMAVKKHWDGMPFPALTNRLIEKTSGRVLRIDDKKSPSEVDCPEGVPANTWKQFQQAVTRSKNGLFYDLKIDGMING